jgi:RND superfamily putative drug exporter
MHGRCERGPRRAAVGVVTTAPRPPGEGRRRRIMPAEVTAGEVRSGDHTGTPGGQGPSRYLDPARPPQRGWSARYARGVTARAGSVVLAWVTATVILTWLAPALGAGGDQLASIIPLDSPALRAEARAVQEFGFPLSSRTVVVQRDPGGMSVFTQAASVLEAVSVDQAPQAYPLLGALPLTNAVSIVPGAREQGTAVLTYLFMQPSSSFDSQRQGAERYIAEHLDHPRDGVIGVAGSVPARAAQASIVTSSLPTLELLTVLAILLVVGVNFRAPAPPLVALAASAVAFLVTVRLAGLLGDLIGLAVPAELEPLLVALLLGVVTDYTVFYVSSLESQLRQGVPRREAVLGAVASFTPIVLTAGLTVAAGTAALLAAVSPFFRAFGPAMAMSVLVALAVSVTLIPALLALLGPRTFWPRRPSPAQGQGTEAPMPGPGPSRLVPAPRRERGVARLTRRPVAAAVLIAGVGVLVVAALPLRSIHLGVGFTQSLPSDNPVRHASDAAGNAFAPGVTSPTTLLIEGRGVTRQLDALIRFQTPVATQPGVSGVFGPAQLSGVLPTALDVTHTPEGVVLAPSGDAARMLVVFDSDPLGARAIANAGALRAAIPALIEASGLQDATVSLAGDSALAEGLVASTTTDLVRIGLAAIIVNLLLLIVFLRALVAPIYLLACSVLALTAALGIQVWVFQHLLGSDGVTFYVPFATAVLLVSLGSDYNIFGVGHVWEEARHRPLRDAIIIAVPQSTRAINAAALTLAVSFGLLALIPLRPFREIALTMSAGVLIDAFIVRSVLVPCLLVLVGSASGWPGPHFRDVRRSPAAAAPSSVPAMSQR